MLINALFITGGKGKVFHPLNTLLALKLDVTNRQECFDAVSKAKAHFGQIDVLINNAGYGLFDALEENLEADARQQIETNVFGLLWVTQAVVPVMREQQHGHIIQISSVLGLVTMPLLGIYNATKFAVEALSETLSQEVSSFGVHVTIVEPNGYATERANTSAVQSPPIDVYDRFREIFRETASAPHFNGIPEATVTAILELVNNRQPPLRLILGKHGFPWIKGVYEQRLKDWETWNEVAAQAHGH